MSEPTWFRLRAPSQQCGSGQDGAVAVVVAISLFMFFAFAAVAIDLGSAWETKRDLNTDLDAAALAGARTLADEVREQPSRCAAGTTGTSSLNSEVRASVRSLLAANDDRAEVADSDITIDCDKMTVRVAGSQPATTVFAGLLGVNEINPAGYAIARAVAGEGGNVLPLTFCNGIEPLASWLAAGRPEGASVTIVYGEGPRDECGGAPGNWGWFGASSTSGLRTLIDNGYPGLITLPPPESARSCEGPAQTADGWCNGDTGAKANLLEPPPTSQPTIDRLKCSASTPWQECPIYTFMVHDDVRGTGTNVDYSQVAFLDAVIRGANQAGNTKNSTISLQLVAWRTGPGESSAGPNSSSLCSADGAPGGDPNCDA
jgi:Flp pilus assembly protein TadG